MPFPSDPFPKRGATRVCPLTAPLSFCLIHNFPLWFPKTEQTKTTHSLATNDAPFSRKRDGFFVAGWGLCYATPHPAKGFASGLQRAFGASLLTLKKTREQITQRKLQIKETDGECECLSRSTYISPASATRAKIY